MKTCEFSGCTEQINVWLKYCNRHSQQMAMQEQQQRTSVREMPPSIPAQKVMMPIETTTMPTIKQVQEPRSLPRFEKENTRKDAMRFAIDLITQTDIEQKPYEQLLNEVRTLTNELQRILEE